MTRRLRTFIVNHSEAFGCNKMEPVRIILAVGAPVDDKTKTRPQDSTRINMNEDYEVAYWTKRFGVTKQQLQSAVDNDAAFTLKETCKWQMSRLP